MNDQRHVFSKENIDSFSSIRRNNVVTFTKNILHKIGLTPEEAIKLDSKELYMLLKQESPSGTRRRFSPMMIRSALEKIMYGPGLFDFDEESEVSKKLLELESQLSLNVLYLLTYRRIERDLKTIFPDLEDNITRFNKRDHLISKKSGHLELVEFGMADVLGMIQTTMKSLDSRFRASLNELTGGYLKVISNKEYEKADMSSLVEAIDENSYQIC